MMEPEDYALQRLRDALAGDERVAEMGVHVALVAGKIFLNGQVTTVERRRAVGALAREVLPDYEVHNETVVTDVGDRPLAGAPREEGAPVIRVAAVGDVHFGLDSAGTLRPHLEGIADLADLYLLAGDLTRLGHPEEAAVLARELRDVPVPVVAVLGNHDYHSDQEKAVTEVLESAGVRVLEGDATVIDVDGSPVGIAGVKGFGSGFAGACGTDFGEPMMKAFVRHTHEAADRLCGALEELARAGVEHRVALMHYAPTETTLQGERLEIYPFLGSYLLGEAVDRGGADVAIHGHAHGGVEKGFTPGGIQVRNVAQPVIGRAYTVYCLDREAPGA
jgi:Icc-related predicted phosphoesterase